MKSRCNNRSTFWFKKNQHNLLVQFEVLFEHWLKWLQIWWCQCLTFSFTSGYRKSLFLCAYFEDIKVWWSNWPEQFLNERVKSKWIKKMSINFYKLRNYSCPNRLFLTFILVAIWWGRIWLCWFHRRSRSLWQIKVSVLYSKKQRNCETTRVPYKFLNQFKLLVKLEVPIEHFDISFFWIWQEVTLTWFYRHSRRRTLSFCIDVWNQSSVLT